jgi:hypothetical protein
MVTFARLVAGVSQRQNLEPSDLLHDARRGLRQSVVLARAGIYVTPLTHTTAVTAPAEIRDLPDLCLVTSR